MKHKSLISALTLSVGLLTAGAANATPFDIRIVVDNDFAIFGGTSTSINSVLYQNNVIWNSQITALSTLTFELGPTDTTFYLLAMGGSIEENISGEVNGVNISTIPVSMSADVRSFLTGYDLSTVSNGTYSASLADVQAAFASTTWSPAIPNTTETVIVAAGFGSGYRYEASTAHLFRFDARDVKVDRPSTNVPEPAGLALFGLGLLGLVAARRRKTV